VKNRDSRQGFLAFFRQSQSPSEPAWFRCLNELTEIHEFLIFLWQRPRRFAPDLYPGIFIVNTGWRGRAA
jgi:hypothetical protein